MWCAHDFVEGSRICVRCHALIVPAERNLARVREARTILEQLDATHPIPTLDDAA